jgi:DNA-directed RNA polymerase specialized sigma24 family protein
LSRDGKARAADPDAADVAIATEVIASLPARHREALIRFYLDREEPATITREFGLSDGEWLSIKSRARTLFFEQKGLRRNAGSERGTGTARLRA